MSMQNGKLINQKEYLKKYLSGDKDKKKKKKDKKHKKTTQAQVKIIDDDSYNDNNALIDEDLLLGGEDAPQIVGEYMEDNADAVRSKWRNIAVKNEPKTEPNGSDLRIKQEPADDESSLWGRKASTIKIKQEISPGRRRHDSSPLGIQIKLERRSSSREQSPTRCAKRRSSDQSPPRRRQDVDASPPRRRRSSDQSPPRRRQDVDKSPSRKRRSSDQSPPRRRTAADQSPPRRRRDSDQSPPRRRRGAVESPPRRRQDADHSPPTRRAGANQSPPRKRRDSDQSPPRRRQDLDQSPPRKRQNSDESPSRRRQSPARRRRSTDQSPPRSRRSNSRDQGVRNKKEGRGSASSPRRDRKSRWAKASPSRSASPPPTHKPKADTMRTLDGKKAGLQDAQSLKSETNERRREEHRMFEKMSSEVSGRDAEVQMRSTGRRGRRARDAAAEDPAEQERKEAHEKKKKELYDRWGKGLKQLEDRQARNAEMAHEAAKPVARYANDEDLDRHLRDQMHADDPMLQYMRQKRKKLDQLSDKPVMPVYEGTYPENRYGIRPGYRWDGVDRSNGYEQRWFNKQSERLAMQDAAYKYSVEDM